MSLSHLSLFIWCLHARPQRNMNDLLRMIHKSQVLLILDILILDDHSGRRNHINISFARSSRVYRRLGVFLKRVSRSMWLEIRVLRLQDKCIQPRLIIWMLRSIDILNVNWTGGGNSSFLIIPYPTVLKGWIDFVLVFQLNGCWQILLEDGTFGSVAIAQADELLPSFSHASKYEFKIKFL